MTQTLLFGCGHSRERRLALQKGGIVKGQHTEREILFPSPRKEFTGNLRTWDINKACKPTRVIDLNRPWQTWFDADGNGDLGQAFHAFDEVHAYEVLEHLGSQGNVISFFNTFVGIWHLLKKGGVLFASVPHWQSEWAWGDPSHTRVITPGSLSFLSVKEYEKQLGNTPMSDFREYLGLADFDIIDVATPGNVPTQIYFALRAV